MSVAILSYRDRRAFASGIATVAIAALLLRGLPALTRWTRAQRQAAQRAAMDAADSRQAIGAFTWMRDSARVRRQRLMALDSAFLDDTIPALAAATLASELSDDAEQTGVTIAVVQSEPAIARDSVLPRVRARLTVSGDLAAIMRFLVYIEAGTPLLAVRELSMTQREQSAPGRPANLRVDLTVEGLVKPSSTFPNPHHE